jgi:transglutaminase-like putative cysteine protease
MDAGGDAYAFLEGLSRALFDRVRNVSRLLGAPHPPEVTLREGLGSCRDFAVLFAACCRHQGLAARFVSGYIPAPAGESQHMHAWAEAHVPGLGWTAWDATQGGPAGESHIRVAASPEPAEASPIAGSYRGLSDSTMSVELSVEIG